MSMQAVNTVARVLEVREVAKTVLAIRFDPLRKFNYIPGQFMSLWVPNHDGSGYQKRAYTFASSYEHTLDHGYEFCIKLNPGGVASEYVKTLSTGDDFRFSGPYGDFVYEVPKPGRKPFFISTGTGLSPFRAMILSPMFYDQTEDHDQALCISGVRTVDELVYPEFMRDCGVNATIAVSRPTPGWNGFNGRVTDFLRTLPKDWHWHLSEYYLCGNSAMIQDVRHLLIGGHGVSEKAIHQESFFA